MTEDEATAFLSRLGYTVLAPGECIVEKRDNEAALAANWRQILAVLAMSEDLAQDGARLVIDSPFRVGIDPRPYMRSGMLRKIDAILDGAAVRASEGGIDA